MCGAYLLTDRTGGKRQNLARPFLTLTQAARTDLPRQTPAGVGFSTAGGANYLNGTNPLSANAPFSIATRFHFNTTADDLGVLSIGTSATEGSPLYLLQQGGGGLLRCLLGDVAYVTLAATITAGRWYTVVSTITASSSGAETHYLDGVQVGTATRTFGTVTTTNLFVGTGFNGITDVEVEFVYLWNRALTQREAGAISRNPFQIFTTSRRTFSVAAGSSTQTGTPGVATVTVTGVAPTAAGSGTATATAGVATVTVSGVAPVATGSGAVTSTPSVATVTVTGVDATASATGSSTVTPGIATVTVSGVDASAAGSGTSTATPSVATVTVSATAPTAAPVSVTVTPGVATVTVTAAAPTATGSGTSTSTPGTAIVTVTGTSPTATPAGTATATAGTATVTVSGVSPTAAGSGTATVTPGTAIVTVTGENATATGGGTQAATPGVADITVSATAPTASATGSVTVTPGTANVTITGVAPTASPAGSATLTPGIASVFVTAADVFAQAGGTVTVTPGTAVVTITASNPIARIVSPAVTITNRAKYVPPNQQLRGTYWADTIPGVSELLDGLLAAYEFDGNVVDSYAGLDWAFGTPAGYGSGLVHSQALYTDSTAGAGSVLYQEFAYVSNGQLTLEAWVFPDSTQTDGNPSHVWTQAQNTSFSEQEIVVSKDSDIPGRVVIRCQMKSGEPLFFVMLGATDQWHHVVMTFDGIGLSAGTMTLYVNGEPVDSRTTTPGYVIASVTVNRSTLGGEWMANPENPAPRIGIGPLRIWNTAKDADFVTTLYNGGDGVPFSNFAVTVPITGTGKYRPPTWAGTYFVDTIGN